MSYLRKGSSRIAILERVRDSSYSLYFYRDLYRCFHILLSDEKKNKKLNI